ncbi:MAG: hypothetical protein Q4G28_02720 [Neisseria sp.]|nr:hypothetical protein [Neisseria sp.]
MNPADQQLAATTAKLLRASGWLGAFSLLLTAAALWQASEKQGLGLWLALAELPLGAAACFWQFRLAFDARLFAAFAEGVQTPEALDAALSDLGLRPAADGRVREMRDRCRGAVRLLRRLLVMVVLQMLLVLCMLVV